MSGFTRSGPEPGGFGTGNYQKHPRPTIRPIRDGKPEERAAYWAMVDRVVARAKPLTDMQLRRVAGLFRSGSTTSGGEVA